MGKLLGVVMCGGESRRMGTDKGLIPQGGKTWAQLCYAKLIELDIPVWVSVSAIQVYKYQTIFKADELIVDAVNIPGPLNGILSVHAAMPEYDLLILACDMIDMNTATLQQLIDEYKSGSSYDHYAYHNGSFFEPLCAIYRSPALTALKQQFDNNEVTNFSLQQVLKNANTKNLLVTDAQQFNNHNERAG